MSRKSRKSSRDPKVEQAEKRNGTTSGKRRLNPLKVTIFVLVFLIITGLVVTAVLMVRKPEVFSEDSPIAVFGVKKINIKGNTKYEDADIVEKSGIKLRQSVFSVDKKAAADLILANFPYVEKVELTNPSFNIVQISITEVKGSFITEFEEGYLIIDSDGKALETIAKDSEAVSDYQKVAVKLSEDVAVGKKVLDERVVAALGVVNDRALDKIVSIDVTDLTSVILNWNDQIDIYLGSDFEINHKLETAILLLDKTLEKEGSDIKGRLTLNDYSEEGKGKYQGVFTPEEKIE